MSEISKVPPYDPANPYVVLNPNAEGNLIQSGQNVAKVPPYTEILAESDVEVMGAGDPLVNRVYTYVSPQNYDGGVFNIGPVSNYPDPGVDCLAIKEGSNIHYYTLDTDSPIGKSFKVGSFGSAPAPAVQVALVQAEPGGTGLRAKEAKEVKPKVDDKATAREEAAEQKFLNKQAELPQPKPKEPSRKRFFDY
jgi:hypothetical protein